MRVRFAEEVLAAPDRYGKDLNAIADRLGCGQHEWEIDDLDALLGSAWMLGRPDWDSLDELATKSFRASVDSPARAISPYTVVVTLVGQGGEGRILRHQPADARRILTSALRLILENATSDGDFVRSVAATWKHSAVNDAIAGGWLVFEQAGGSGEFVKRATAFFAQQVPAVRLLCLMDSDRLTPGPLPKTTAARCAELNSLGVVAFVLGKREVENYLPPSKLDSKQRHAVYVSWLTLNREQQDHYDMKHGFDTDPATGKASVLPEQRALFADVSEWHRGRLLGGFGKAIGDRFDGTALNLDELEFCCRTEPDELRRLLQWLEAAL